MQQHLNRFLDTLPRTRVGRLVREAPAFASVVAAVGERIALRGSLGMCNEPRGTPFLWLERCQERLCWSAVLPLW